MTGRLSHEELEELISADALDGLDEADRSFLLAELAEHGPDCPQCLRLIAEYSQVAERMAMTLSPVAMSPGAEERLVSAAREGSPAADAPISPVPPSPREPRTLIGSRFKPTSRWLAAVAAAAALAVLAGFVGYRVAPRPEEAVRARVRALEAQEEARAKFLAFAAQPGIKIVAFPTTGDRGLAVAFRPGQTEAWIWGTNLPTPAGGKVYELWFQPNPSAAVQPAGTFAPTDGTVLAQANLGPAFTALAVSIEPPGGSPQPTLPPVYQTAVTA
jgi:hypothetical protein